MKNRDGMTRAQTIFLRAFKTDPFGPGVEKWPSPAVLRRWLRRPGFVQAMRSVREALRYQADFQLLSAAASAAHVLHTSVSAGDHEMQKAQMKAMSDLMKLAHVRQRFAPPEPPPPVRESILEELVCTAHPNATIDALRQFYERQTGRDLKAEWDARRKAEQAAGVARELIMMRPIGRHDAELDDEDDEDTSDDDTRDDDTRDDDTGDDDTGDDDTARADSPAGA